MVRALPAAVVALFVLLVLPRAAAGAEAESAAFRRCMAIPEVWRHGVNRCLNDEARRQGASVDRRYRTLLARQPARGRSSLQAAQRAWRLYRDRQCDFAREEEGPYSGFGVVLDAGANCELYLNLARAGDLRRLLKGTPRPAGDAAEAARQERALEAAWRRTRAGTEEVTTDLPQELSAKPPHPRAALDAAQRAWRLYRDRQCGFEADEVRCRIALARERIAALER